MAHVAGRLAAPAPLEQCLRKLLLDNPAAHSFGAHVLPAAMEQTYADGMPYLASTVLCACVRVVYVSAFCGLGPGREPFLTTVVSSWLPAPPPPPPDSVAVETNRRAPGAALRCRACAHGYARPRAPVRPGRRMEHDTHVSGVVRVCVCSPGQVSAYLPAGYWADVGGSMRAFLKVWQGWGRKGGGGGRQARRAGAGAGAMCVPHTPAGQPCHAALFTADVTLRGQRTAAIGTEVDPTCHTQCNAGGVRPPSALSPLPLPPPPAPRLAAGQPGVRPVRGRGLPL